MINAFYQGYACKNHINVSEIWNTVQGLQISSRENLLTGVLKIIHEVMLTQILEVVTNEIRFL